MANEQRFIRLKEQRGLRNHSARPSEKYLAGTDGKLRTPDSGFHLETDENGFIKTGQAVVSGRPALYVTGGSFVESTYNDPSRRFVAQAAAASKMNVFNAGYSGTTLLQALLMIIAKIPTVARPGDTVLVFVTHSDSRVLATSKGYWIESKAFSPIVPTLERSTWRGTVDDIETILSTMQTFLQSVGINLVVSNSPFRECDYDIDSWLEVKYVGNRNRFERTHAMKRMVNRKAVEVCEKLNIPCCDLASRVGSDPLYFYDEYHLTDEGQNVVSEELIDFLSNVSPDFLNS